MIREGEIDMSMSGYKPVGRNRNIYHTPQLIVLAQIHRTDDGEYGILVNVDDKKGGIKTNMMFDFSESIDNNIAEFVEKIVSKYYGSSPDRFHLVQNQIYTMCGHYFISMAAKGGNV